MLSGLVIQSYIKKKKKEENMSTLQVLILYSTTFNDASNSDYGSFVDLIGQRNVSIFTRK